MRDHKNENHVVNCGDYELSDGCETSKLGLFIKTKSFKLKVTNHKFTSTAFAHHEKVVVCARTPIL